MKFAHQVKEKGPNEYAVEAVVEDIESLGIKRFIFKWGQSFHWKITYSKLSVRSTKLYQKSLR